MKFDMYRDLCSLLGYWWSSDRIRVSPHEGQLLRIQPGDLLTVAGVDTQVVSRSLIAEHSLCLACQTEAGPAELRIPTPPNRGPVSWHTSELCRMLTEDDILVWRRSM